MKKGPVPAGPVRLLCSSPEVAIVNQQHLIYIVYLRLAFRKTASNHLVKLQVFTHIVHRQKFRMVSVYGRFYLLTGLKFSSNFVLGLLLKYQLIKTIDLQGAGNKTGNNVHSKSMLLF